MTSAATQLQRIEIEPLGALNLEKTKTGVPRRIPVHATLARLAGRLDLALAPAGVDAGLVRTPAVGFNRSPPAAMETFHRSSFLARSPSARAWI